MVRLVLDVVALDSLNPPKNDDRPSCLSKIMLSNYTLDKNIKLIHNRHEKGDDSLLKYLPEVDFITYSSPTANDVFRMFVEDVLVSFSVVVDGAGGLDDYLEGDCGEIFDVFTREMSVFQTQKDHRCKGYGTILLKFILGTLQDENILLMTMVAAHKLYYSAGAYRFNVSRNSTNEFMCFCPEETFKSHPDWMDHDHYIYIQTGELTGQLLFEVEYDYEEMDTRLTPATQDEIDEIVGFKRISVI